MDPNAWAVANGQFLGLNCKESESDLVIIPVPWDVTTSYRPGTSHGPRAIIQASYQLDLFSPYLESAWEMGIFTQAESSALFKKSAELRTLAAEHIQHLASGHQGKGEHLREVNAGTTWMNEWVYAATQKVLSAGKIPIVLGGDHSVPFGSIKACAEKEPGLSILHFDAHADLREAYEGFKDSHASIMFNVLQQTSVDRLVQVGIRDISIGEVETIRDDKRVSTWFDWEIKDRLDKGEAWAKLCQSIVEQLSDRVYVSFDIDALDPKLCPNTGTPVPGGLEYTQVATLLRILAQSGRRIVGADLVEVAPGQDEWDANVGARILMQICVATEASRRKGAR